jgi:hypothetical protein
MNNYQSLTNHGNHRATAATGATGATESCDVQCALSGEAQMHRARCDHAERILGWYENHVAPCEVKAREAPRFLALFELLMSSQ